MTNWNDENTSLDTLNKKNETDDRKNKSRERKLEKEKIKRTGWISSCHHKLTCWTLFGRKRRRKTAQKWWNNRTKWTITNSRSSFSRHLLLSPRHSINTKYKPAQKIHKILLNLKQEQPEQQSDELTGDEGKAGVCFDRAIEQLASLRVTKRRSIHRADHFHPSSPPLRFALPVWLMILSSKTHTSALARIQTHIHLRIFCFFPPYLSGRSSCGWKSCQWNIASSSIRCSAGQQSSSQ